jgi:hypothetical protein
LLNTIVLTIYPISTKKIITHKTNVRENWRSVNEKRIERIIRIKIRARWLILYFVVFFMMVKRAKKWAKMSEDTKFIGGISAIAGAVIIVALIVMNEALSH